MGDIIRTSNGYKVQSLSNLRWIISNSGGTLNMRVKDGSGQERDLSIPL